MSNKRRARGAHAGGGKGRQRIVAERTSTAEAGFVHVDQTRTFLTEGVFAETMIDTCEDPVGLVRLDLHGRWSKRVERLPDDPVLQLNAEFARELGQILLEAADAADRDADRWRETQTMSQPNDDRHALDSIGTVGPCPNPACVFGVAHYTDADTTQVACDTCTWEGFDEEILGNPRTGATS